MNTAMRYYVLKTTVEADDTTSFDAVASFRSPVPAVGMCEALNAKDVEHTSYEVCYKWGIGYYELNGDAVQDEEIEAALAAPEDEMMFYILKRTIEDDSTNSFETVASFGREASAVKRCEALDDPDNHRISYEICFRLSVGGYMYYNSGDAVEDEEIIKALDD